MKIIKLVLGACSTNCYIVASEKGNAVLIDAADEAEKIIVAIEENHLNLKYIFVTHGHTDHVLALEALKARYQAPIMISKAIRC